MTIHWIAEGLILMRIMTTTSMTLLTMICYRLSSSHNIDHVSARCECVTRPRSSCISIIIKLPSCSVAVFLHCSHQVDLSSLNLAVGMRHVLITNISMLWQNDLKYRLSELNNVGCTLVMAIQTICTALEMLDTYVRKLVHVVGPSFSW